MKRAPSSDGHGRTTWVKSMNGKRSQREGEDVLRRGTCSLRHSCLVAPATSLPTISDHLIARQCDSLPSMMARHANRDGGARPKHGDGNRRKRKWRAEGAKENEEETELVGGFGLARSEAFGKRRTAVPFHHTFVTKKALPMPRTSFGD